ncbi:hypothetical protein VTJ83DRAFT_4375 [Remersonia thermophila]|uniref:FAM192A/Fyv6 N-terminal domain-containing protein n=1 Tax=Remersonia thermophila TaxID=72144 RepID=A0ABR4D9Q2_9PEZI
MASRFVSAGAINPATGDAVAAAPPPSTASQPAKSAKEAEKQAAWAAATASLEAARQHRLQQQQQLQQQHQPGAPEQRSLYDILQANKLAKQEAQAEALKLKHQFRGLDEDEAAFLEGLRERRAREEEERRREVESGMRAFREKLAGKAAGTDEEGGGGGGGGEGREGPRRMPLGSWRRRECRGRGAGRGGRRRRRGRTG